MLVINNFDGILEYSKGFGKGFSIHLASDMKDKYFVEYGWWSDKYDKWKKYGFVVMKEMVTWGIYRCYAIDYGKNMAYPYTIDIKNVKSKDKFIYRMELAASNMESDTLKGDFIFNTPELEDVC